MPGDTHRRYPPELRERAVRMVAEIAGEHESEWAAMTRVSELLGVGTRRRFESGCAGLRSTRAPGRG
jgi:transposase